MDKDYLAALLADMEAKKAALEAAISGVRAALASGALGVPGDLVASAPMDSAAPNGISVSLPRGAFLGKKATDAITLYLGAARSKKTNKEIGQALKDGGMESTGSFDNLINGALFQLKNKGIVLRGEDQSRLPNRGKDVHRA